MAKIEERESYKMFANILQAFRKSEEEGLETLFKELNKRKKFGSIMASKFAKESLEQLILNKDNGNNN